MRKRLLPIFSTLLCSAALAYCGVWYLLREHLPLAMGLLALLFMGGFWHRAKPGTIMHASWLGLGIGAFLALTLYLGR